MHGDHVGVGAQGSHDSGCLGERAEQGKQRGFEHEEETHGLLQASGALVVDDLLAAVPSLGHLDHRAQGGDVAGTQTRDPDVPPLVGCAGDDVLGDGKQAAPAYTWRPWLPSADSSLALSLSLPHLLSLWEG